MDSSARGTKDAEWLDASPPAQAMSLGEQLGMDPKTLASVLNSSTGGRAPPPTATDDGNTDDSAHHLEASVAGWRSHLRSWNRRYAADSSYEEYTISFFLWHMDA